MIHTVSALKFKIWLEREILHTTNSTYKAKCNRCP